MSAINKGRVFTYQSGTGKDAYLYSIRIDSSLNFYIQDIKTPIGNSLYDSLVLPESVVRDMVTSLNTLQAGGLDA